jgi:outer membrane murein-binding lipoprotein Lpp
MASFGAVYLSALEKTMSKSIMHVALAAALSLLVSGVAAESAEMAEIKRMTQEMKQQYESRIRELEQRVEQAESRAAAAEQRSPRSKKRLKQSRAPAITASIRQSAWCCRAVG